VRDFLSGAYIGALDCVGAHGHGFDTQAFELNQLAVEVAQVGLADRAMQASVDDQHREGRGRILCKRERPAAHDRQAELGHLEAWLERHCH
jgi:hypothetical protein